jgi:hypothetical protein
MGCRGREEMGGMRWAKGEVRRKDCVRVITARRVSVPYAATSRSEQTNSVRQITSSSVDSEPFAKKPERWTREHGKNIPG